MDLEKALDVLKQKIFEVFPEWESRGLQPQDSLKELGANSIDRAEILMLTMAELKLKMPMIEFGQAKNIKELAEILTTKS